MTIPGNVLTRLPKESDLLTSLNETCKQHGIRRGSVQVIGAVERATLRFSAGSATSP